MPTENCHDIMLHNKAVAVLVYDKDHEAVSPNAFGEFMILPE
jgi:hypothetical protein